MQFRDWLQGYLSRNREQVYLAKAFLSWPAIIGEEMAAFSKPVALTPKGTLVVMVKEASGLTELQYRQVEIIEKYKAKFPRITIEKIYLKLATGFPVTDLPATDSPATDFPVTDFASADHLLKEPNHYPTGTKSSGEGELKESSSSDNSTSLDFSNWLQDEPLMKEKLLRLKEAWQLVNERKKSEESKILKKTNEDRQKKNHNIINEEEEPLAGQFVFPQAAIKSLFLSYEDEFQPFDLY